MPVRLRLLVALLARAHRSFALADSGGSCVRHPEALGRSGEQEVRSGQEGGRRDRRRRRRGARLHKRANA